MHAPKAITSAMLALSLLVSGHASASNDPVVANPNTGENFNRYVYANNNPYKFTDPDGRNPVAGAAVGVLPLVQRVLLAQWLEQSSERP